MSHLSPQRVAQAKKGIVNKRSVCERFYSYSYFSDCLSGGFSLSFRGGGTFGLSDIASKAWRAGPGTKSVIVSVVYLLFLFTYNPGLTLIISVFLAVNRRSFLFHTLSWFVLYIAFTLEGADVFPDFPTCPL